MGYRCWSCRQEVPGGEEVWRDGAGDIVQWGKGVIVVSPAPFHPTCGEEFAKSMPDTTLEELVARLPSPKVRKVEKSQMDLF